MSIDDVLRASLEDHRLSRRERSELRKALDDAADAQRQSDVMRQQAFVIAREQMDALGAEAVMDWLEDVVRAASTPRASESPTAARRSEVYFSPGKACREALIGALTQAQRSVDICVFTITDDRLSDVIEATHRRGVAVRIATDDDKAFDLGSDIRRLEKAGIPTRVDRSEHHMHHKFAIFDGALEGAQVATGSYNWTRSASEHNRENLLLTDEPGLVRSYAAGFEALWRDFAPT